MARSPLLTQLNRLVARAQRAAKVSTLTGEPLAEAYERLGASRPTAAGPSRRDLLKLGALTAAGPLLPACTSAPATQSVVVVGAGLAGLHCAYRLWKDHGVRATVYEAQKRLGGRREVAPIAGLCAAPSSEVPDRRAFLAIAEACLAKARSAGAGTVGTSWGGGAATDPQ